jgi:hypothetical protein
MSASITLVACFWVSPITRSRTATMSCFLPSMFFLLWRRAAHIHEKLDRPPIAHFANAER